MRDAFGGVFMFNLFIIFIFIYVAFAAVSLNYAKAFRLKNSLINFVEENEIIDLSHKNFDKHLDELDEILDNANYNKTCDSINETETVTNIDGRAAKYCYRGILIERVSTAKEEKIAGTNSKLIEYKITTYADWNLGVLNKLLALNGQKDNSQAMINGSWQITGEAQVVDRG